VRGRLPLSHGWRRTYLAFRVAIAAAVAGGVGLFLTTRFVSPDLRSGWVAAGFGSLGLALVTALAYGLMKPRGEVITTPEGELWIRLRDAHPNFADAVAPAGTSRAALL